MWVFCLRCLGSATVNVAPCCLPSGKMIYRLRSGFAAIVCFTALNAIANPGLAQPGFAKSATEPGVSQKTQIAIKVGEAQTAVPTTEVVAKIHTHSLQGKQAATLYVRNIPVFTFLSNQPAIDSKVKLGGSQNAETSYRALSYQSNTRSLAPTQPAFNAQSPDSSLVRAAEIATKLNQFYREGVSADTVQVAWRQAGVAQGQYVVEMNGVAIAAIDAATTFAQTTSNPEQDALQVANRLRRLLGDAKPLTAVQGKPVAIARRAEPTLDGGDYQVRKTLNGWASWYGPGFDGNQTASGERFNQNALTAAHKSLPFGTKLRVTNLDTGRSVIVRINDRGPYAGDRILDLSAGAAEQIGLADSGVAQVKAEILESVAGNLAGR
jgi:rare lipoprotein A